MLFVSKHTLRLTHTFIDVTYPVVLFVVLLTIQVGTVVITTEADMAATVAAMDA